MPHENAGRADKLGNLYEDRWDVNQLLRLLNEEIFSVTIEAIGEDEKGIDLWIKNKDGSRECHQCKSRNGSKEYWTFGDLNAKGIFEKAKLQLNSSENVTYHFISAVPAMMMYDLTNRARNSNNNSEDFYKFQITKSGEDVNKAFNSICKYFGCSNEIDNDRSKVFDYLKRMYFVYYPDDINEKNNLKFKIKHLYVGDTDAIYSIIKGFAIENDLLGREIKANILHSYLLSLDGVSTRQLYKDERLLPRIEALNEEFISSFIPIDGKIIPRTESDECYRHIKNGTSVIIHGKAGSGKSGCVFELIDKLKNENIVHLALKLDRRIPKDSADKYGESLGLPASPVLCLEAISVEQEVVLILDQLDAIRWTNNHSSNALEVCKEIIREVKNINLYRNKKIVLVFVCRTFDFENDNGIKSLFKQNYDENKQLLWADMPIAELNEECVKHIVGDTYNRFSKKLQELLKTPSNLYTWTRLDEERKDNNFLTSRELIKVWWEQLISHCEITGISNYDLITIKDTIINSISRLGKLMIPEGILAQCSQIAKQKLRSGGLLISSGAMIGFTHQSYYDYFLVEKMFVQILEGNSIISILGDKYKQNPEKRYQLQMLLENIAENDLDIFINIGRELLQSDSIRFYFKYVFLQVLGQLKTISQPTSELLKEYLKNEYWQQHVVNAVIMGHHVFVEHLIRQKYFTPKIDSNFDMETSFMLLKSVNEFIPDEIVDILSPLSLNKMELEGKIYSCLCWKIEMDSDKMFELRIALLNKRLEQWDPYIDWKSLLNEKPERAVKLLELVVKKENYKRNNIIELNEIEAFTSYAKNNAEYIWVSFMSYVANETKNISNLYDESIEFWECHQYMKQNIGRTYINMIKVAAESLISINTQEFLNSCEFYYDNSSLIVNEVILHIIENLPDEYSDYAILWLIENPHHRFFNYTGENDDYLFSAKNIFEKHSKTCSDEVFSKLENVLYFFHEKNELSSAKHRFEYNFCSRKEGNKSMAFWPYWGRVQYSLLPALDSRRATKRIKELKNVLNRRFEKMDDTHKRNRVSGGSVISTISGVTDKISDKQWLKIIENKYTGTRDRIWVYRNGCVLDSSPEQFSGDLERVGEKDPNRFVRMALTFSDNVDNHYISAINHIIGKTKPPKDILSAEDWKPADIELSQLYFKRFGYRDEINVVTSFCRAIQKRANENWDDEIFCRLADIAVHHTNPEQGKMNVTSSNDKEGKTVNSLHSNSMNCVRGCAIEAVATLLWKDYSRLDLLKGAIVSAVHDTHLAVNMAAIECVLPLINIDRAFAIDLFFNLAKKDLRLIAHPYAYKVFYYFFNDSKNEIKEIVTSMFSSEFEDVAETGARHIANMYILHDCFEDIFLNKEKMKKVQKQGILDIAINLMEHFEHKEKCKKIIELFIEDNEDFSNTFAQLFYRKVINIEEDLELILKITSSKMNRQIMHNFVEYMVENDVEIEVFKDIITGMCQNLVVNAQKEYNDISSELYGISEELSRLIAQLYDRSRNMPEINLICLDLWDLMFEKQIGSIRKLSELIANC